MMKKEGPRGFAPGGYSSLLKARVALEATRDPRLIFQLSARYQVPLFLIRAWQREVAKAEAEAETQLSPLTPNHF